MTRRTSLTSSVRIVLAAVAWFAVLLQFWLSVRLADSNGKSLLNGLVIYFGYFTIITNIFIALVCTAPALSSKCRAAAWFSRLATVGCATTGILLVGITYHFLLREIWSPQGAEWLADGLLHYVVPAVALVYWVLCSRGSFLAWWLPIAWCAYPVVYMGYALVRGELTASYPYPFIDVSLLGYPQVLVNSLGLLGVFIVLGFLILGISRIRSTGAVDSA